VYIVARRPCAASVINDVIFFAESASRREHGVQSLLRYHRSEHPSGRSSRPPATAIERDSI